MRRAPSSRKDESRPVPLHLRNAPTKLMKDLGYGKDYRYAHDEADAYAAGENYFPDGMPEVSWYQPTDRGLEGEDRREARASARTRRRAQAKDRGRGDMTDVGTIHDLTSGSTSMLDIQLLRNDLDAVATRLADRGFDARRRGFEALEQERKDMQTRTQELQAQRNSARKQIGQAKAKGEDAVAR